jgi:hypothetical protein
MALLAAERALLEETVRGALGGRETDADGVLEEVGWLEMLDAEPADAIGIVFEALGACNAASTALDDVLASALGTKPRADLAVLLPRYGSWTPTDSGRVNGLATARIATARHLLVVSDAGAMTLSLDGLDIRPLRGIDPSAGWHVVQGAADGAPVEALDAAAWDLAIALGRRAVAHETLGAGRTMLALAREHAVSRVQFGRPIAAFQAVRHRLAESLVAVEALDATLQAAADEPNRTTAALAKATAGRAARTVATHCQQVLAGVGFTTEHTFHRSLKRTMLLDGLFGSADEIAFDLGRQLLAVRRVPTLIEL